jgi:hypothetical protein
MPLHNKTIIAIIVTLGVFGLLVYWLVSGNKDAMPLAVAGLDINTIKFTHTDENEGEDLIITSDKKTYQGFSGTTVYFNVDPLEKKSEEIGMQFYFTDPNAQIVQLYKYQKEEKYWLALPLNKGEISSNKYVQALARRKEVEGETLIQSNTSFNSTGEKEYFMAEIAYTPGTPGQFLIEAFGSGGSYGILDPWYDSGWAYRKKITINPEKVSGGLSNFPMLFSRTDLDLRATASGGHVASTTGGDILFTDENDNKIPHEIEKYTSTTGELVAWVNVPFLSSTSTRDIYIYYGNSTVTANQENPTGVWDSNYFGVWHLPNGSSLSGANSVTGLAGTLQNGVTAGTGYIDGAGSFDGTNDRIDHTNIGDLNAGAVTLSAWINTDSTTTNQYIFTGQNSGNTISTLILWIPGGFTAGSYELTYSFTTDPPLFKRSPDSVLSAGTWYYLVVTHDGSHSVANASLYRNGVAETSFATTGDGTGSDTNSSGTNVIGGRTFDDTRNFDGLIDEVRASTVIRPAEWIATEYNNQVAPNTFYSYSGEGVEIRSSSVAGVKIRGGLPGQIAGTATRSTMGATLTGTDKWVSGALGPDGKIYGIPWSSTDILIIDPVAGTATRSTMGATLTGTFKWISGTLGPYGKIYGVPDNATDILIIDPVVGTATRSTMGATLTGESKWLSSTLGPDGKIYGIPWSSTDILIIDPLIDTATLSTMGADLTGVEKWIGAVLGPDNKIYGIPDTATDILIIPFTTLFGADSVKVRGGVKFR